MGDPVAQLFPKWTNGIPKWLALAGPIIVIGLLFLLHNTEPLGGDRFPAAQGVALAGVIEGITGGDVPVQKYVAGAGLGAVLSASGIGGPCMALA